MAIINVYKPLGWTPLQVIDQLREQDPALVNTPMTYAGRLDPMAEGVMLILSDDDRYKRDEFLNLDKTYEAEFLFRFESDTYDALGLATHGDDVDEDKIEKTVQDLKGTHKLPFPPYSSYKIDGKPLHWWARNNRLSEIEIPIKVMKVLNVGNIKVETRKATTVLEDIIERIKLVNGDFRQDQIIEQWKNVLRDHDDLIIASLKLDVTSGTYIRTLAHDLGKKLDCGALLYSLKRTRVGEFSISDSIK